MANIQLPPVDSDDPFRRLLRKEEQVSDKDTSKIEDVFDDEEKLFNVLDEKIQKVYKTFTDTYTSTKPNAVKTSVELLSQQSKKTVKTIDVSFTIIKEEIDNRRRTMREKLIHKVSSIGQTISSSLFSESGEKAALKYESVLKTLSKASTWVTDKISSAYDFTKKYLTVGLEFAVGALRCVTQFFLAPFKAAWNIIDSFLTKVTGPIWKAIKGVISLSASVVKWIVGVGITAVSYIWKGFSTVFKVGFTVISKSVKYLALGVKGFFGWWFKMLTKTIFSPSMWLINIPLFIGLSVVIFAGITSLLVIGTGVLAPAVQALFDGVINVVGSVGGWIWGGIQKFFSWVSQKYESSGLKAFVDKTWTSISESISTWLGGHDNINKGFTWISKAYHWVKANLSNVVNWVEDQFVTVTKFFSNMSRETLLQHFMDILEKWKSVPGFDIGLNFLKSRFGFTAKGGANHQLRDEIQRQKVLGFQETLQNALLSLPKGLDEKQFNDALSDQIEKLQSGAFGGLSDKIVESVKRKTLDNIKNGSGSYSSGAILGRQYFLQKLNSQLKLNNSGLLDANDPEVKKSIELLLSRRDVLSTQSVASGTKNLSSDDFKKLLETLNQNEKQNQLTRTYATQLEILERNTDDDALLHLPGGKIVSRSQYNKLTNQASQSIYGLGNILGINDAIQNITGYHVNRPEDDTRSFQLGDDTAYSNQRLNYVEQKFAKGGVVAPAGQNVIPLDSVGREYIRKQVAGIAIPDENKIKSPEDDIKNITIIEDYTSYMESYEVYTMRQLSNGILGAK